MSTATLTPKKKIIHYPDSDGQPTGDNTKQFEVISTLKWNIEACLSTIPDVFTGGDLLIYAVEGSPKIRVAPDVLVAFGRPRGYRGSYKVWEEDDIFPQVVMEVWSPNNRRKVMNDKFKFYEKYGAEEYYIIYPDAPAHVEGWLRSGNRFQAIDKINGFVSPRLRIRFLTEKKNDVRFIGPDGREFFPPDQMAQQRNRLELEVNAARNRLETESARAATEKARAEALAAKLRALGVDPDSP